MANEISGRIKPLWRTDIEMVKEFMNELVGRNGWTSRYSFGGTGKNVPWRVTKTHVYSSNNGQQMIANCTIRFPKEPTAAIEILGNEINKSSRDLPLSTLALFYVCASVHYKLCCMQINTNCYKKLQHKASIECVCAETTAHNCIYNNVVKLKQQRAANKKQLAIAKVGRDERRKIREDKNKIKDRFDILDL